MVTLSKHSPGWLQNLGCIGSIKLCYWLRGF
jgi:hypothetical protein